MSEIKLTKTQLRLQQIKLGQLQKYLPTLQLKKAMLQNEVNLAQTEIEELEKSKDQAKAKIGGYSRLLTARHLDDLFSATTIEEVKKSYENIAGSDVPIFQDVSFYNLQYSLFETPLWYEAVIHDIKQMLKIGEHLKIVHEKKEILKKELREVSIRVNLFEKIMIPRALENIKKIKIFLGDQQLAAISQAKVAKKKIIERNR